MHIHKIVYKTVGLDEQAYGLLRDAKQEGESFSDVVRRLLGTSGDWRRLVGVMGDDGERLAVWHREHRARERADARRKWGD